MTSEKITVLSVNRSKEKGTVKKPVPQIVLDEKGIQGDAHAGVWHRQVSLLSQESIELFSRENEREIRPGEFAENITTQGIDLGNVCVLDRFVVGECELEVTQIGKRCHGDGCAIYQQVGKCVMPKEGIFCRVIRPGTIVPGASMIYKPRELKILVITVSDRASRGEYQDKGGPKVSEYLESFFSDTRWHIHVANTIIPDEPGILKRELNTAKDKGVDIIFTTGGTGVGPRDITPDVVMSLADKVIPGIMENIRVQCGRENPNALLSRSVAAIMGTCVIYTLPGSVRAIGEYTSEIFKTLEHVILMLHHVDVH